MIHTDKHKSSILFVDDDEDTLKVFSDVLLRRVDAVYTAANGRDGLETYICNSPNLIITDIRMSESNGVEFIKSVRELDQEIPIIAFSAYVGEELLAREIKGLVNHIVRKPADTHDFIDLIDTLLKQKGDSNDLNEKSGKSDSSGHKDTDESDLIIVGIGASAGGLEALTSMIKGLPRSNNSAYVIAQHLSPTHQTMLIDLLSRETDLPVKDAVDGLKLQSDTIYITPPNKDIEINSLNEIVLKVPDQQSKLPKPSVNRLFISIAKYKRDKSIGIILSGTGSDGTQGMRAINAEGGITIVQEPKTAKYDGMPLSAINGCSIDIVIPTSEIGSELSALANFPRKTVLKKYQLVNSNDDMSTIMSLLYRHKKVDFSLYKSSTIGRRIERRMVTTKATSLSDYVSILLENRDEVTALFKDILIGVTSFFRDVDAFSALRSGLERYLDDNGDLKELRIWIPGTSTGEEAYSVIMTLMELLDYRKQSLSIRAFATDIDDDALFVACRGVYSESSIAEMNEEIVSKYFVAENNEFTVHKSLRESIVFSYHNILADPPFKNVDLIVCRNMLIYLNQNAQNFIMPRFHYALNKNGLLFLGKSENATNFENYFATVDKQFKLFRKVPSFKHDFNQSELAAGISTAPNLAPVETNRGTTKTTIRDLTMTEAGKVLLPSVIVCNEQMEVLYNKGRLSYVKIPEGYVSYNIFKLLDAKIAIELRHAVKSARMNNEPDATSFLPIGERDAEDNFKSIVKYVRIHVIPVYEQKNFVYVFYFQEICANDLPKLALNFGTAESHGNHLLEFELQQTKEHMQTLVEELETSNEELQSTNEELQSSNEELQSTNEELETSNEELQSTNEELQTAYAELKEVYNINNQSKREIELLNERYEKLLDNINNGVMVTTLDGIIVSTNKALQHITGMSREQLLTRSWDEFDSGHHLSGLKTELIKNGKTRPYQLDILDQAGQKKRLEVQHYLITVEDNNQQVWSFLFDITSEIAIQNQLIVSEQKFKETFEQANIGIAHVAVDGGWISVNDRLCRFLGYDQDELLALSYHDITFPEDSQADLAQDTKLRDGTINEYKQEKRYIRKDGEVVWASKSVTLISDVDQVPLFFIYVIEDINERKARNLKSEQTEVVFNRIQEGIMITDRDTNILSVNPAMQTITGYAPEELVGRQASVLKSGLHSADFYKEIWLSLKHAGVWSGEIINKHKNGDMYPAFLNINSVCDAEQNVVQYISVLTDISLIKKSQEKIQYLANHDVLTKLPNRTLLQDRIARAVEYAKRHEEHLAIMFIDLDRFKVVNDGLGHNFGDKVLIEVARRFEQTLRKHDTIARLGGDEFVALIANLKAELDARKIAKNIIKAVEAPMHIDGHTIQIGASIGISLYPNDGITGDELLRQADIAMYEAKKCGESTYYFSTEELSNSAFEKATMENAIRNALDNDEFYLQYQPIIDLKTRKPQSVEALLRWRHPQLGIVMPSKFIPLAEESDLIKQVTMFVAGTAIQTLDKLKQLDCSCKMTINFSARDFESDNQCTGLRQIMQQAQVDAEAVMLELTERNFMFDNAKQLNSLKKFEKLGVGMSVDDFGTGYSNLGYLSELPVSCLKIDRSFIAKIGQDAKSEEIIKATIGIARSLDLISIGEGVETKQQYDFLLDNGCDYGQGYYICKPVDYERIMEMTANSEWLCGHA